MMPINLILFWPTTYAIGDDQVPECVTDPESFWVCEGDEAFQEGFIISPKVLQDLVEKEKLFDQVKKEREEYRGLSDQLVGQRDAYQEQRDVLRELLETSNILRLEYQKQRDESLKELSQWEDKFYILRDQLSELEKDTQGNWNPWEVGLLSGGVAVAGVLAGIGLGYLISL